MRKLIGIALVISLAIGSGAFAAESVTDTVGVSYDASGKVVLLGMVGTNTVMLRLNGGSYGQTTAGARAALGGGSSSVEAVGGYLHYTTYGEVDQKITVQKDSSTTFGYLANSLSVRISNVVAGGSVIGDLGLASGTYQGISTTVHTLIQGIIGYNTWTGTGATEGAQVMYQLSADPGVSSVDVLYTILANS
jgi:hypothetical protein